jgi:heat shock protein HtpX
MLNVYEQIASNKKRSWLVIIGFIAFISTVTYIFSQVFDFGLGYVGMALILAGLTSFASYWFSDSLILGISGARPANRQEANIFYSVAENLTSAARLPMPRLYVLDDTAMNAFATGRDPEHAVVCATAGLLSRLNRSEIEAVIAHEISHIRFYDMRLMSIVTVLVGMITLLSDWLIRSTYFGRRSRDRDDQGMGGILMLVGIFLALLSPLIAQLIKLALSRRREFQADAGAVMLTRQPSGLITALQKLGQDREPLEAANKATAHLYIVNPLRNLHQGVGWFAALFNTHPPLSQRIKELEKMV